MDNFIPVSGPWITEHEVGYVAEAVRTAWFSKANDFHNSFENACRAHFGVAHAMALPSCTSGLHLALAGLGIGPGDEVIVPDTTWIATSAPISYVGAEPVFVDIDPVSWCISPAAVERAITERTRAVITVDLYGGMPDYDALNDLLAGTNISLIEDAAEAIGSTFRGKPAGAFGRAATFSFHGSKTITMGEGGLLLTDDEQLFRRAQILRDHGRLPGDLMFRNEEVGFKYKVSSMQAALGLAQLERLPEIVDRKRAIFGWYKERLSEVAGIELNAEPDGIRNSFWMVTAILENGHGPTKEEIIPRLREKGVDSRPFFYPLSSIPAYCNSHGAIRARQHNHVAYAKSRTGINLPSGLQLQEADVDRICEAYACALRL